MHASLTGRRITVLVRHGFEKSSRAGDNAAPVCRVHFTHRYDVPTTSIIPLALDVGASAIAIIVASSRRLSSVSIPAEAPATARRTESLQEGNDASDDV
jgi:hypothetical protein